MIRSPKRVDVGVRGYSKSTRKSKSSDYPLGDPHQNIETTLCWQDSPHKKTAGTNTLAHRRAKAKQGTKKCPKSKCTGDGGDVSSYNTSHSPSLEEVQKRLNLVLDLDLEDLGAETTHIEDKSLLDAFKQLLENKEVKNAVDHWIKLQFPRGGVSYNSSSDEQNVEKDQQSKEFSVTEEYLSLLKKKCKSEKSDVVPRCQAQTSLVPPTSDTTTKKTKKEIPVAVNRDLSSDEFVAVKLQHHEHGEDESQMRAVPASELCRHNKGASRPHVELYKQHHEHGEDEGPMRTVPASEFCRRNKGTSRLHVVVSKQHHEHGEDEGPMRTVPASEFCRRNKGASRPHVVVSKGHSRRAAAPKSPVLLPRKPHESLPARSSIPEPCTVLSCTSESDNESVPARPFTPPNGRSRCTFCLPAISKENSPDDRPPNQSPSPIASESVPQDETSRTPVKHSFSFPPKKTRHKVSSEKVKLSRRVHSDTDSSVRRTPRRKRRKSSKKLNIDIPPIADESTKRAEEIVEHADGASTASSSHVEYSQVSSRSKKRRKKFVRKKNRFVSANTQTSKNSHNTNSTQTRHYRPKKGQDHYLDKLAEACRLLVAELNRRDEANNKGVPKQEIGQQTESPPKTDAEVNTSRGHRFKSLCTKHSRGSGAERRRKHDNKKCSQRIQTEDLENSCIIPFLRSTNDKEAAFSLMKLSNGVLVPYSDDLLSIPYNPNIDNLAACPPLEGDTLKNKSGPKEEVLNIPPPNSPVVTIDHNGIFPSDTSNKQNTKEPSEKQQKHQDRSKQGLEIKHAEQQYTNENEDEKAMGESFIREIILNLDDSADWSIEDTPQGFSLEATDCSCACVKNPPTDGQFESYVLFANAGTKYPVAHVSVAKRTSSPRSTYSGGQGKSAHDSKVNRATSISRIGSEVQLSEVRSEVFATQTEEVEIGEEAATVKPQAATMTTTTDTTTPCFCDASTYYCEDGEVVGVVGQNFDNMCKLDSQKSHTMCELDPPGMGATGMYPGNQGGYAGVSGSFPTGSVPYGSEPTRMGGGGPSSSFHCQFCCQSQEMRAPPVYRNPCPSGEVPVCQIPPGYHNSPPSLKLVSDLGPMQGPCGRAPFAPPPIIPCSAPPTTMGSVFGPCPKHGDVPVVPTLTPCPGSGPLVSQDEPCTCNNWNNWNNYNGG